MLRTEGAIVTIYDPEANANAKRAYGGLFYADSLEAVSREADVVVLLTEWQEFRDVDPEYLGELVSHRRIVDGRHALDADEYRAKGWEFRALGRPAQSHTVTLASDIRDEVLLSA
jgi:UDPglucose 6-dehydrogenase